MTIEELANKLTLLRDETGACVACDSASHTYHYDSCVLAMASNALHTFMWMSDDLAAVRARPAESFRYVEW